MIVANRNRRVGAVRLATLLTLPLIALVAGSPVGARSSASGQNEPIANSQVGCGVRVYMTASGSTGADTTNDGSTKTSLENGTDLCVTVGVQYKDLSTVAGSVTPANYDVLYVQGQNNWGSSDRNAFLASDYAVIDAFISAGAGVVIGEWLAWNACASSFSGAWASLDAIMPVSIRSNCDYGSNMKVRFYRWERPTTPSLDTGVSPDFIFEPADYAGSLSFLTLKNGAIPYYWATWDINTANVPAATDPANLPSAGGVGMAGWVPTGKSGRVFSFSTTNGAPELTNTNASNSIRRLLINSLGWAGSVGGAITPDAIATSGSVGSSLTTPAMTPSKIVGTVTYSITNGTLPAGLTLDPTTGSISGTPTSGGNVSVTVQAVGSTSGTATATIALNIAGGQTPTATTVPATPTTTSPSNVNSGSTTTSTIASNSGSTVSTTTIASKVVASSTKNVSTLPAAGNDVNVAYLALILAVVGLSMIITRKKLFQ